MYKIVLKQIIFKPIWVVLLLVFTSVVSAQEACNCKVVLNQFKENLNDNSDSLAIFKMSARLKKSKWKSCLFEGLQLEFDYYINNSETKKAKVILDQQLQLLNRMSCKTEFNYDIYYNKLYYYRLINDVEKWSAYTFKTLKEAENGSDVYRKIAALQDVVQLFTKMNESKKIWPYILKTQQIIESEGDSKRNIHNYNWLAMQYESEYARIQRKTLIDSALLFAQKAKKGAFKYKKYPEITTYYRIKEACAYRKGDVKTALKSIDSAIFFGKKIKGNKNLAPLYSAKAWDHLDNQQLVEADKSMDTALVIVQDAKDLSGRMMMHYDASDLYSQTGNIAKAFESYKTYSKMKDSIWNMEKVEKVNELEQKYLKVENEKKIFELEKTKQFYLFFIIAAILLLLTLVFFFRQRSVANKQKIMETEQRLNRARINPHFFFNAMASLQNLALQEKSNQTTLFISRFAKIMRQSLENTYEELVTVENEIEFTTHYLELQQLRFIDKFDYEFIIDKNLEIDELQIPGMIVQPFIENSIDHGFKNIDYKGKIDIRFEEKNNHLLITVSDNGKGQLIEKEQKTHKSRAMEIIKDRLYLFNKKYNSDASYTVIKKSHSEGFAIEILLPKMYTS